MICKATSIAVVEPHYVFCQYISISHFSVMVVFSEWHFLFCCSILKRGYLTNIHEDNEETVQEIREEIINTRAGENTSARRMVGGEITCPICLTQTRYAVETNCGHIFCGRLNRC